MMIRAASFALALVTGLTAARAFRGLLSARESNELAGQSKHGLKIQAIGHACRNCAWGGHRRFNRRT